MDLLHRGKQSVIFPTRPVVGGCASVVGKKEADGPLGNTFDLTAEDAKLRKDSWEKAETQMQKLALGKLLQKTRLLHSDVDLIFSGDLLNQCIGSSFALRRTGIPAIGLYGACSTMAEGLMLAGAAVNAGYAQRAIAMSSSHFASAERQYRFPLGYGGQRTPTSQWTVTGCGAVLVQQQGDGVQLVSATAGTVEDKGIKDANNMGAAMAWAAYRTIRAHLDDLHLAPEDFDLIVTGDLGFLGKAMVEELFSSEGVRLGDRYTDCGVLIYDLMTQDVNAGGSGCGCSASVLCGHILPCLEKGIWRRVLFAATGALMSPTSSQQGGSIPGICHAVVLERRD